MLRYASVHKHRRNMNNILQTMVLELTQSSTVQQPEQMAVPRRSDATTDMQQQLTDRTGLSADQHDK